VIALGIVLGSRYLMTRKRAQLELAGGEQYRRLADEYRRLADLAITAQEHTDLRLTDRACRWMTCERSWSRCSTSSRKSSSRRTLSAAMMGSLNSADSPAKGAT